MTDPLLFDAPVCDAAWLAAMTAELRRTPDFVARMEQEVEAEYRRNPRARDGYARLGLVLMRAGRLDEARALYLRDLAAQRISWWQHVRLAELTALLNGPVPAGRLVAALYRKHPEARNGYSAIAIACQQRGRWTAAARWYDRDHALGRQSPGCMLNRAEALARRNELTGALAAVSRAYRLDPALRDGYSRIARWLDQRGLHTEALAAWRRDHNAGRQSPEQTFALFTALAGRERHVEALARANHTRPLYEPLRRACAAMAKELLTRAINGFLGKPSRTIALWLRHGDDYARLAAEDETAPVFAPGVAALLDALRAGENRRRLTAAVALAGALAADETGEASAPPLTTVLRAWAVFPRAQPSDIRAAARAARTVAGRILGRHCGMPGDKLAQYLCVSQCARAIPDRPVDSIEIGTLYGGSCLMRLFAMRRARVRGRVVCVDPMSGYYGGDDSSGVPVRPATLQANLRRFGFHPAAVELRAVDSSDPAARRGLAPRTFAILMIDGDHSREGVLNDWRLWSGYVRPGGLVLFDDYGSGAWPGVRAAVDRILKNARRSWIARGMVGRTLVVQRAADNETGDEIG